MTDTPFTSNDYLEIRLRGVLLNSKIFKKLSSEDIKTVAVILGYGTKKHW